MKGRSQLLSFILVFIMLANVLVACGGGGNTGAEQGAEETTGGETEAPAEEAPAEEAPAEEAPAEEAPAEEAPAEEGGEAGGETAAGGMTLPAECSTVQLDYWNPFTGPDGPFMGQMVDAFNAENPNIQVTMTTQAEYYTQLGTAQASNTLPDVAIVHADQLATQAFRNIIRPIPEDILGAMALDAADFPEKVWNAGDIAGGRYAVPLDIHPMTMFYNADLVPEPPTNAEEFEAAANAVTDGNGFMITTGFPVQQIFEMLLAQFGGSAFNEEGTEATWNSEAGVQALQWMLDAQSQWSESNLEVDAELNAFRGGTVGMIWNGIWQTTSLTGDAVEFDGRATSVPQIGPNPAVWAGSHQLTLPVQAEDDPCVDAAAGIFISYLLANSVTWAQAGQIPASATVRESAEFQALEAQAAIAPSVENALIPPSVPGIGDAYAPLGEAVSAVMGGTETDIQAALDAAAEAANQILAQNAETFGDAPGATE
jgi:multiple sugar transport system substrate-binding protein